MIQTTSDITVRLIQQCGGDWSVVAAAKVSTNGEEALKYADPALESSNSGLINYLMKMRHGTPFEHSFLSFFVHAPIFVWREWHRHRIGFSYNEESARYKQLDPVFYLPVRDRPMIKVEDWKPGRPRFLTIDEACKDHTPMVGDSIYNQLIENLTESYEVGYRNYEKNLGLNIDPGLARDCLSFGIYSSCWVSCNPRSLMDFLSKRTYEPNAKYVSYPLYEIEVAAKVAEDFLAKGWPITYKAFCANGRVSP